MKSEQTIIEGCKPNNRPDFESIKDDFFKGCFGIIKTSDYLSNNDTFEYISDILKDIFASERWVKKDAYDLAKKFERDGGFNVDRNFIDLIEEMQVIYDTMKTERIKEWVKHYDVTPKIAAGMEVKYRGQIRILGEHSPYNLERGIYAVLTGEKNGSYNPVAFEELEAENGY